MTRDEPKDKLIGEPIELRLSDLGSAGAALGERIIERLEAELAAAVARAEDAEAEIDGMLEQESFLEAQLAHMQQDLDALREREADLLHTLHTEQGAHDRCREELAAREWRPVTEPPPTSGIYLTYNRHLFDLHYFRPGTNEWLDSAYGRQPTHWQPLPTPPQDDAQ